MVIKMNKMIKSLLMMGLAVFVGQAFAADPVAVWTDFSNLTQDNPTLTSGMYTLTADMSTGENDQGCAVNADGSITLGGTGLELTFSVGQPIHDNNSIVVVMDITSSRVISSGNAE